jgi:hypothetical protein
VFSAPIVLVVVLVLGWGQRRFARLKEDEWRKQAAEVTLVPREKLTDDVEDEDEEDWDMRLNRYVSYATMH